MTEAIDEDRVAVRWWAWLDERGLGPQTGRPVVDHDRVEVGDGAAQVFAWQVFVRANAEERRSVDLLLVALLERSAHKGPTLVVVGPETLRAQTLAGPAGLTITEIGLGPVTSDLRAVSLALVRVPRASRSRDVLTSIETMGRFLDDTTDPDGSGAVAQALMRRIEVLTAGPGVRVSVAGSLRQPQAVDTVHLLADAPLALDDDVELREGRLTVVTAGRAPAVPLAGGGSDRKPWVGGDYVLVRVGRPVARPTGQSRPLAQRRMEHALAADDPGADVAERTVTYSERVAAVRQSTRAQQVVRAALAGDTAGAVRRLSSALTEPGAEGPLAESLADEINTVADYWMVAPLLRPAGTGQGAGAAAAVVGERLDRKLDQLLGLGPGVREDLASMPVVTPIVLEISDVLVPIVDSRLDGGRFLDELIPAMRDRIRDRSGVRVPGVRGRGNPNLPPGRFVIQIEEIPVATGDVRVDGRYAVRSVAGEAVATTADIAEIHPLTGEPGRWQIDLVAEPAADAATFTAEEYLIYRLEREIQRSLRSMLGLQEVDALLGQWREDDAALVDRVVVGQDAAERLTVVLEELVNEQVPIGQWRVLLAAVADAGGIGTHVRDLQQAVRRALRQWLPGLRDGPTALRLPAAIEAALGRRDTGNLSIIPSEGWMALTEWLQQSTTELGPVLTVITEDAEARRRVAVAAQKEQRAVLTLSAEELG